MGQYSTFFGKKQRVFAAVSCKQQIFRADAVIGPYNA